MAANAFIELGLACDLFQKGATHNLRVRSGLGILGRLRERALQVYSQFRTGGHLGVASVGGDYGDDELALFGGQTRVLFSHLLRAKDSTRTPNKAPSPNSGEGSTSGEMLTDVHPSLVEYLSLLPASDLSRSTPTNESGTAYDSIDTSAVQHPYPTSISEPNIGPIFQLSDNQSDAISYADFGMITGDSVIDDQWRSFLRESGVLDRN